MRAVFFTIISLILISCSKENTEPVSSENTGRLYYPAKTGITLYYDVTEINIDRRVDIFDTTIYELKEYFESEFTDQTGEQNLRIEQYKRFQGDSVWQFYRTSYVMNGKTTIERVDDNIRIVNINFPLKINKKWNGNAKNNLTEKEFTITGINATEQINNLSYNNNVLIIVQEDVENMIEKFYSVEKYAKNTGLIYKEIINIEELEPLPGTPWQNRINRGTIFIQKRKEL